MTTRSSKNTATVYNRCTPVQLASVARQWQTKLTVVNKMPNTSTYKGHSVVSQRNVIKNELKKIANVLRTQTIRQINAKIKTLKSQQAKRLGVKVTSSKATSSAVKRLQLKARQINSCKQFSTLAKICTGVKLSTYKNPVVRSKARKTVRSKTRKTTTKRYTTNKGTKVASKYKRQTNALKREVHKQRKRNSFMRKLINRFRKKVATLQRQYRTMQAKPRWKVIEGRKSGKTTSNVIRFHRNIGNSTKQHRYG